MWYSVATTWFSIGVASIFGIVNNENSPPYLNLACFFAKRERSFSKARVKSTCSNTKIIKLKSLLQKNVMFNKVIFS